MSNLSTTPFDYACRLLARRAYSEQELTDRLTVTGFTAAAVARAVAQLKAHGYLDDMNLSLEAAARLRARGYGLDGIRFKLSQKGIAEEIIEHTLNTKSEADDLTSARRLLASRFSADALQQPQTRARAFRLLLRRGYAQDIAERLLDSEADELCRVQLKWRKIRNQ